MVKISIIVPVHNSEETLYKCVSSLVEQTLEDIEIILVDDCSQDASPELMADYQAQFPDMIRCLYLKENIRQGGARNRGMDIARGEYIAFVDSDDFIEPDMCRVLYETAQGADMCGADYLMDWGTSQKDVFTNYGEGREMTRERRVTFVSGCGYFWSRIYRREFLEENDLRFPENTYYEDTYFNFMTALYAKTCVKAPGKFYHYWQSQDSTIRSAGRHQYERIDIPTLIINDCRKRGIYEENKDLIDYKYIAMQMGNIRYVCLEKFNPPEEAQLRRIRLAILEDCPDYEKGKYFKNTLWQLRHYLKLTMKDPKKAIRQYRSDNIVELKAVIRGKLGLK